MTTTSNWFVPPLVSSYVTPSSLALTLNNYETIANAGSNFYTTGANTNLNLSGLTTIKFNSTTGIFTNLNISTGTISDCTSTNLSFTNMTGTTVNMTNTMTGNVGAFNNLYLGGNFTMLNNLTGSQDTSLTTTVTLNSAAGIITLYNGSNNIAGSTGVSFTFNNSYINSSNSTVFATFQKGGGTGPGILQVEVQDVGVGTCTININNCKLASDSSASGTVHYLVINS